MTKMTLKCRERGSQRNSLGKMDCLQVSLGLYDVNVTIQIFELFGFFQGTSVFTLLFIG